MFNSRSKILTVGDVSKIPAVISGKIAQDKLDPTKTIILYDLDLTILDRFGIMSDLHATQRKEFIAAVSEIDPALARIAYDQSPYHLIEPDIANIIKNQVEQGFIVLGFTARRTGKAMANHLTLVEEDICLTLQTLGINFTQIPNKEFDIPENSVQLENPHLIPYQIAGKPKIFGEAFNTATIFTANYPKEVILSLVMEHLATLEKKITDIIEVDDKKEYLQNLKSTCDTKRLNFTGLHYTFANEHKQELNTDVIAIQKTHLIKEREFISESQALNILEMKNSSLSMTV